MQDLERTTQEIRSKGSNVRPNRNPGRKIWASLIKSFLPHAQIVPDISYTDIKSGLDQPNIDDIKKRGCLVVRNVVPETKASLVKHPETC